MSAINPLTAGIAIQLASTASLSQQDNFMPENKAIFGENTQDIVNISTLGREKLQQESLTKQASKVQALGIEVVRVSSSIGKSQAQGNLTSKQALALYNDIAALL